MDVSGWFDSSHFWFFLLAIVASLVSGYFARKRNRRLAAELQRAGATRGWNYVFRDDSFAKRFRGKPFGHGSSRQVRHLLHGGHRGRWISVFQYQYTTSNGENSQTHYYLVATVGLPVQLPYLELSTEKAGHKLLGMFGKRDLQLESEDFNQRFHIQTDSDRFAYDILHPRMMQWMLADWRANQWPFRFAGTQLVTWHPGKANFVEMLKVLDFACDVADTVPQFVLRG